MEERDWKGEIFEIGGEQESISMGKREWNREIIPDDVRFEILKRLPAKSLMRFKCVCSTWRDIIEDRICAEHHHFESKCRRDASYILLFVDKYNPDEEIIFPVNCLSVSTTDIAWLKFGQYSLCTDVVEGLACVRDNIVYTLSALNVTTGEKLRLPPGVKMRDDCATSYFYPRYFLGFDPLNKSYKLLHFRLDEISGGCEILTLGENSWREIDPLSDRPLRPKVEFVRTQRHVCVNGAIYWISGPSVIIYFDVHAEKFMQLDPPHGVGTIFQLTRVGDKLGLLCSMGTEEIVLWTLSPSKVWKMQEMPHVRNWIDKYEIIGITRTGRYLLKPKNYKSIGISSHDPTSKVHKISFISYDPTYHSKGQMFIKISHPWVSSSDLYVFGATCDHVENILPLKTL